MTEQKKNLNNNRLKEIRLKNKRTQKDLAKFLGVSEQAIAYYEQAKREPSISTWEKLASYFNVPTSYLMGVSNDINGWEEWSKNTGYTVQQIKNEIARLIKTKRLDEKAGIQYQIGQAVKSLDSTSYSTTQGVQHELVFQLINLIAKVDGAFLEPRQKNKSVLNMVNYKPKVRKDMDEKAYKKIIDVLTKAKYEIGQIPIDKKYL